MSSLTMYISDWFDYKLRKLNANTIQMSLQKGVTRAPFHTVNH